MEEHITEKAKKIKLLLLDVDGVLIDGWIIYDSRGKEIASVGIFIDLQERLAMERTLRDIQEKLLQSEKLAAMGKLTSQIAHELNNPLYGIMNTLELLKSEVPSQSKRRKILDDMTGQHKVTVRAGRRGSFQMAYGLSQVGHIPSLVFNGC